MLRSGCLDGTDLSVWASVRRGARNVLQMYLSGSSVYALRDYRI